MKPPLGPALRTDRSFRVRLARDSRLVLPFALVISVRCADLLPLRLVIEFSNPVTVPCS